MKESLERISGHLRAVCVELDALAMSQVGPQPQPAPQPAQPTTSPNGVQPPQTPTSGAEVLQNSVDQLLIDYNDANIEFAPGVRVERLVIRKGVKRVRIAGGEFGSIDMEMPYVRWPDEWDPDLMVSDVLIDGARILSPDSVNISLRVQANRCRIQNCTVSSANFACYAVTHNQYGYLGNGIRMNNVSMANNRFVARDVDPSSRAEDQTCVRLLHIDGLHFDNNEVVMEDLFKQSFRLHNGVSNALVERNTFRNAGVAFATINGDVVEDLVFRNNQVLNFRNFDLFHLGRPARNEGTVLGASVNGNLFEITPEAGDQNNALLRYMPGRTTPEEDAMWDVSGNTVVWTENGETWNG